jgi:hypothetical protein
MRRSYSYVLTLVVSFILAGMVTSCEKACGCSPMPALGMTETELSRTWRLDEISKAGQVTSSGSAIKDRYTLTFQGQGNYTQKLLTTGDEFTGTWKLTNSGHTLDLIDHKGAPQTYEIRGNKPSGGPSNQISLIREIQGQMETKVFNQVP